MMPQALITCEFLIAPGRCPPDEVDNQILNVLELSSSIKHLTHPPLLEANVLERLTELEAYPTEKFFRNTIRGESTEHTAKDIARIIHSIIQKARTIDDADGERIIDWHQLNISPELTSDVPNRATALTELLGRLALLQNQEEAELDLIHSRHPKNNKISKSYDVNGLIDCCVQNTCPAPSGNVTATIRTFELLKEHLSYLDYKSIFEHSKTDDQLRMSFYCGALAKLRARNIPLDDMSIEAVTIGAGFVKSLNDNQSGPGMHFSSILLDVVTDLLCGHPKYEVSTFYLGDMKTQRTFGTLNAYRTHITKSGVGLRLMLWKNQSGRLTLANIGPKHELEISEP